MKKNKVILTAITTLVFAITTMAYPFHEAYAFNLFRETWNLVRGTTRFVVSLPDKATRWMGPVLGPAASFLLTKNILKNPKISKIFRSAQKTSKIIENIEEVKSHVNELKGAYKDEAKKLRAQADKLEQQRKDLAKDLLEGKDFDEYKSQVAHIQRIIDAQRAAADQLDKQANNLTTEKFVQMLGNKFIKNTVGDIRDIVINSVAEDLLKTTDANLIKSFIDSDGSFDTVLDFMVQRELYGMETENTFDMDALRDRIKQQIKDKLDENKDYLKENWKEELQALIKENYDQMKSEADELKNQGNTENDNSSDQKQDLPDDISDLLDEFDNDMTQAIEKDKELEIGDCPVGYKFLPRSGVGCVQINCNEVSDASHYSYTGRCICGSAGSINENPEDPNKICSFPSSYESCPGCVYACVHSGEDCPLDGYSF